jgi:hypothetical protein
MMIKRIVVLFSLVLFLAVVVAALEVKKTEFVVSTEPYQNLSITVVNSDSNEELQTFVGRARKFGEYRFTYYGTISKVELKATIVNNETGEILKEQKFGPYTLGVASINLNFSLGEAEEAEKETEAVEVNESEEVVQEKKNPLLGMVIGENGEFSKVYYYIGAGVFGAIILIIILRKRMSASGAPVEPHPKKIIRAKIDKPSKIEIAPVKEEPSKETIADTEKRIADLQKQLEQIRSEEKLLRLQKQLDVEKQSLKRMQEGDAAQQSPPNQNESGKIN